MGSRPPGRAPERTGGSPRLRTQHPGAHGVSIASPVPFTRRLPPGGSSRSHFSLLTSHFSLLTSHFSLAQRAEAPGYASHPDAHGVSIASPGSFTRRLPPGGSSRSHFPLPTSHFSLPTSHFHHPSTLAQLAEAPGYAPAPWCARRCHRVASTLYPQAPARRLIAFSTTHNPQPTTASSPLSRGTSRRNLQFVPAFAILSPVQTSISPSIPPRTCDRSASRNCFQTLDRQAS
ncbi:MAG: hypothetical protein RLZZ436_4033 [Planctomycetota bacterium]